MRILSRGGLLKVFARSDEENREEIVHDVIERTLVIEAEPIPVAVEDGIVRLRGVADRKIDSELIGWLALGVTGIVDVRNELTDRDEDTKMPPPPLRPQDSATLWR